MHVMVTQAAHIYTPTFIILSGLVTLDLSSVFEQNQRYVSSSQLYVRSGVCDVEMITDEAASDPVWPGRRQRSH